MDKKKYTTPYMEVLNVETWEMLAASSGDTYNMRWSGKNPGTAGPGDIDDESTYDSF